ncbi:MAG TPA: glycosyltransferase family 4 protein [Bryobacteraceae bacterium]|nr:glycosyltransferase family 4 protein [Bryobacteraceae bacterium]
MNPQTRPLVVVETHPVQYHAPVYRAVQATFGVPVTVVYGSDFSIVGYRDKEFGASFSWDTDLTAGTEVRFLSRVRDGGARSFEEVSGRGLMRAVNNSKPSAVLMTGYSRSFHMATFWAARFTGCPLLFRAETSDRAASRTSIKSAVRDWTLRRLYASCECVLPIGSNSYEHYRRLGVAEEKMHFAPYCVNTASFRCDESSRDELRAAARRDLGLAPGDIGVLFSGKLSVRKGVHVLTEAVKRLSDSLRNRIVLVFLGAGSEKDAIEAASATAPIIRVCFPGFRNQTELSPFYHAADMLALPSLHSETWGLVVNEALHHGVPCVVSDSVGCAPDLIEEGRTGFVAKTSSADSLARALDRTALLADDAGTREQCRRKANAFSVESAAEGIAKAWREAVIGRAPAAAERGVPA